MKIGKGITKLEKYENELLFLYTQPILYADRTGLWKKNRMNLL